VIEVDPSRYGKATVIHQVTLQVAVPFPFILKAFDYAIINHQMFKLARHMKGLLHFV
jgi:hypothetical protein